MKQPVLYEKEWSDEQRSAFENAAKSILYCLPSSLTAPNNELVEGRQTTPQRFSKMMMEMLEGELYTNKEIIEMFKNKVFAQLSQCEVDCNFDDIKCFSFCEHHLALMYDLTVSIRILYTPDDNHYVKVIGLSKIPRICELVCKRLQLQERITADIHYILSHLLGLPIEVVVRGKHSCVSARGIKKDITFTSRQQSITK